MFIIQNPVLYIDFRVRHSDWYYLINITILHDFVQWYLGWVGPLQSVPVNLYCILFIYSVSV